jgi:hypothetical protein
VASVPVTEVGKKGDIARRSMQAAGPPQPAALCISGVIPDLSGLLSVCLQQHQDFPLAVIPPLVGIVFICASALEPQYQ